jgi:hypothetical protein
VLHRVGHLPGEGKRWYCPAGGIGIHGALKRLSLPGGVGSSPTLGISFE